MKKTIVSLIAGSVIFFAITSYKNIETVNKNYLSKVHPQTTTVSNVTQGVTTTFQYFSSGGLYSTPVSSINGFSTTLTAYSHSTGTVYVDKFYGTVNGYDVDVTITGLPNKSWKFQSVTVIVP